MQTLEEFCDYLKSLGYKVQLDLTVNPPCLSAIKTHGGYIAELKWIFAETTKPKASVDEKTERFWSYYVTLNKPSWAYSWTIHDVQFVLDELELRGRIIDDPQEIDWALHPDEVIGDILRLTSI